MAVSPFRCKRMFAAASCDARASACICRRVVRIIRTTAVSALL
jgi:hypothetical protein